MSLGSIKDLEQSRVQPTRAVALLVAAIETDPALMARVAGAERDALALRPPVGNRWVKKERAAVQP